MKSFLESCILAASLAFVGWLMISTFGMSDLERIDLLMQNKYKSYPDVMERMAFPKPIVDSYQAGQVFDSVLHERYPHVGEYSIEVFPRFPNDIVLLTFYKRKTFPVDYLAEIKFYRVPKNNYTVVN